MEDEERELTRVEVSTDSVPWEGREEARGGCGILNFGPCSECKKTHLGECLQEAEKR